MSDIPEDILAAARAAFDEMDLLPYDEFYEEQAELIFARSIITERERIAQSLEALVEQRREEKPKAHLGNSYILSCASFIRRGRTPSTLKEKT